MKLLDSRYLPSTRDPNYFRWEIDLEIETQGRKLAYWFEYPNALRDDVVENGDPLLVFIAPLAAYFNEPIRLDRPVDRRLRDNQMGLLKLWADWNPKFHIVPIEAPVRTGPDAAPHSGDKTVACFSGGVDSFFTLLRHYGEVSGDGHYPLDDLITISGFNTSMDDLDAMTSDLSEVAERFDMTLHTVLTNVRYGDHGVVTPYSDEKLLSYTAYNAFLSAVIHGVGRRYREFIVPSTRDYGQLVPNGSHPMSDPLFTSGSLNVVHDGAQFNRVERTELIAGNDMALKALQVCWWDRKDGNCCVCQKCVRNMATLDMVGAKDRATSFKWDGYSMDLIATRKLMDANAFDYYKEVGMEAAKRGRNDIVAAVEKAIRDSRIRNTIVDTAKAVPGLKKVKAAITRR